MQTPASGAGRVRNDYGMGLYCAEHLDMAREWAVEESRSGYANSYALDDGGLTLPNPYGDDFTTLHWLAALLQNRTGELAAASGVSVRTIQEYEQRRKDINKAKLQTDMALAQALSCDAEALLERVAYMKRR